MFPIPSSLTLSAGALLVGFTAGWYITADYKDAKLAEAMLANARTVDKLEAKAEARIEDAKNEYVATITKIKHSADDLNDKYNSLLIKRHTPVSKPTTCIGGTNETPNSNSVGFTEVTIDIGRPAGEIIRLGTDLDEANAQIVALQRAVRAYMLMSYDK